MMDSKEALFNYCLRLADNNLILGHRLSELSSKGPILEEDIALTNIALDLIGQARHLYQYAAELEDKGRTEDDLAYKRAEREFYNTLLSEQPNGDFAFTIVRQFFIDVFDYFFYQELLNSKDTRLAELAGRAIKEVTYHLRHSAQWMLRLGDGTEESHQRIQTAVEASWMYTGELFEMNEVDEVLIQEGVAPDLATIKEKWNAKVNEVLAEATLKRPEDAWMQTGSREGRHSEHLGYILAELQYLPRAYPDAEW